MFYSHFAAAGLDVRVEDSTSRGRLEMAVLFNDEVYLFEFKTVGKEPTGAAMAQLREKGYADKYRHLGEPIHLIGVEFSREERNLAAFAVERALSRDRRRRQQGSAGRVEVPKPNDSALAVRLPVVPFIGGDHRSPFGLLKFSTMVVSPLHSSKQGRRA